MMECIYTGPNGLSWPWKSGHVVRPDNQKHRVPRVLARLAVPVRKWLVGQQLLEGAGCLMSQLGLELLTGQMDRHATGICGVDGMVAEPSLPWGI